MKFDVIIGNPPFKLLADNGRQTNKSIWKTFLVNSLGLSKPGGYIAMVHPLGWGAPADNAKLNIKFFTKLNLVYANATTALKSHFPGVSSTFSYTITKNESYAGSTIIKYDEGETVIDFRQNKLVTTTGMGIIKKITTHTTPCTFKLAGKHDQYPDEGFHISTAPATAIYKNIHHVNSSKDFEPGTVIPVRMSERPSPYANQTKIVIPYNGPLKTIIDDGKYGIGWCQFMVIDPCEIAGCKSVFESKVFRFFASQKHTQYNETKNLNLFPKLDYNRVWTDQELYTHFGFTDGEIEYIEAKNAKTSN
jgi:hypothetical protein